MAGHSGTALSAFHHDADEFKIDEKQVAHAFYLTEPPVQVFNQHHNRSDTGFGPFSPNAIQSPLQIYTNFRKTPISPLS
jgi:hypothetical protein